MVAETEPKRVPRPKGAKWDAETKTLRVAGQTVAEADAPEATEPDPLASAIYDYGEAAKAFVSVNTQLVAAEAKAAELRECHGRLATTLADARRRLDALMPSVDGKRAAPAVTRPRKSATMKPHWHHAFGGWIWLGGGKPDEPCPGKPAPEWAGYGATEGEAETAEVRG